MKEMCEHFLSICSIDNGINKKLIHIGSSKFYLPNILLHIITTLNFNLS